MEILIQLTKKISTFLFMDISGLDFQSNPLSAHPGFCNGLQLSLTHESIQITILFAVYQGCIQYNDFIVSFAKCTKEKPCKHCNGQERTFSLPVFPCSEIDLALTYTGNPKQVSLLSSEFNIIFTGLLSLAFCNFFPFIPLLMPNGVSSN